MPNRLSNRWVQLVVVPQNGGRLMQVTFAGHPYLFVNPKLAGQYLPPSSNQWFNYGGDKLWLLPEGTNDEQHWPGNSDVLDDGPFTFRKISEGQRCEIELTGPSDPQTGIQFTRTIRLDSDSPRIVFHASMKNVTGHTLEWSMQSVSQYDTSAPAAAGFSPGRKHEPRFLDVYSGEPIQQLFEPLSRSIRSRGEPGGHGQGRRSVCRALCSHGGRIVARFDGRMAGGRRRQEPICDGRALSIR